MSSPLIKVSWGELIDKISILEIKVVRLSSAQAVANAQTELTHLMVLAQPALETYPAVAALKYALQETNMKLWEIEDKIRAKEQNKSFDHEFVELARAVYFTNDERSALKRKINDTLSSEIIEEKQYTSYQ